MNTDELQKLINLKEVRQFELEGRLEKVINIEKAIDDAYLGNYARSFYYIIKRTFLIVLVLILFLVAAILLFSPELIFNKEIKDETKRSFVEYYQNEQSNFNDAKLLEFSKNLLDNRDSYSNPTEIKTEIDKYYNQKAEAEYRSIIKMFAIILIIIALILLYIARLTRQLRKRNTLLIKSDDMTKLVIEDFNVTIKEEKNELAQLKKILLLS